MLLICYFLVVAGLGENATVSVVGKKPTKAGQTLQLHCNGHGTEPIAIQWFRSVFINIFALII